MGQFIIDERMRQLFKEERSKLSDLPDSDFIALNEAWKKYWEEKKSNA